MINCTCQHCGKSFEARETRSRPRNRFKPKFCTTACYGKARTLSAEERKARKKKRNKEYYLSRKNRVKAAQTKLMMMSMFRETDYA